MHGKKTNPTVSFWTEQKKICRKISHSISPEANRRMSEDKDDTDDEVYVNFQITSDKALHPRIIEKKKKEK